MFLLFLLPFFAHCMDTQQNFLQPDLLVKASHVIKLCIYLTERIIIESVEDTSCVQYSSPKAHSPMLASEIILEEIMKTNILPFEFCSHEARNLEKNRLLHFLTCLPRITEGQIEWLFHFIHYLKAISSLQDLSRLPRSQQTGLEQQKNIDDTVNILKKSQFMASLFINDLVNTPLPRDLYYSRLQVPALQKLIKGNIKNIAKIFHLGIKYPQITDEHRQNLDVLYSALLNKNICIRSAMHYSAHTLLGLYKNVRIDAIASPRAHVIADYPAPSLRVRCRYRPCGYEDLDNPKLQKLITLISNQNNNYTL